MSKQSETIEFDVNRPLSEAEKVELELLIKQCSEVYYNELKYLAER